MRSVIMKPLTMLVMDANRAMAPNAVIYGGWSRPVMTIEPTTAMAEIAFVRDINGVCNNRDTRLITPSPMNVASMNTNSVWIKSVPDSAGAVEDWAEAICRATTIHKGAPAVRMCLC